ncbi:hypothetical protein chiPu_0014644 [Chiloscyllium punctatum]|uniref:GED domain-containing protein n=1 Tax=Chiloscyllium punctatum TaxID=137246 RepID=A0A401T0G7_CHIPU|nr:hypothetical protein [Chiloscyllium punctatum]
MDTMFYKSYEEKIRPCKDLIDSLRRLGVAKDLALPAIAVIGDQSSGKSSVSEALSGVSLPRGSEKEVEEKLSAAAKELERYGEGVPDTAHERMTFMIQIRTEDLKKQQENQAEMQLQIQFKIENVMYVQDSIYSEKLIKKKSETKELVTALAKDYFEDSYSFGFSVLPNNDASIEEMALHLETYSKIATDQLANQIPLIIGHYILQEFTSKLQIEVLQLLQEKDHIDEYLHEERCIAENRKTLRNKLEWLTQAHDRLSKFY